MMKKKWFISCIAGALLLGAVGGGVLANNQVKIVVNGQDVVSDVAPFMRDNRVMVPISVVSRALGASVGWDQKTQTVSINVKGTQIINVWPEELDIYSEQWAKLRNHLSVFMAGYDQQDDQFLDLVVTDEFKQLKHNYIPIGGIFPGILNYDVIDAKRNGDGYTLRVQVIRKDFEIREEAWDVEFDEQSKISAVNKVSLKLLNSYHVFPGLSYR